MLNLSAIRNFAFEGIDPYILSVYANNVASIIISGGFSDNVNIAIVDKVERNEVGNKAFNLAELSKFNDNVPEAYFLGIFASY